MIPVIRKSLVILLTMMQLSAPLVHAHTGSASYTQGFHIPGLELYGRDVPAFQDANAQWDFEGLLLMVAAGIENPQAIMVESAGQSFVPLPSGQLQLNISADNDCNFSPQIPSFGLLRLPATHSPRAPPAQ
jgi:hypothetical protein